MAALTNRQASRERLRAVFEATLDRLIPAEEQVPLEGGDLAGWEAQADLMDRQVVAAFIEERAKLDGHAEMAAEELACPHCQGRRIHMVPGRSGQAEAQSPHGVVVLPRQAARCRSCGRSFSPSGPGLGAAGGPGAHPPRRRAGGAGGGAKVL